MRLSVLIVGFLLFINGSSYCFQPEIFVAGKQYMSMKDYKLERLRKVLRMVSNFKDEAELNVYMEQLLVKHPWKSLESLSDEELAKLLVSYKDKSGETSVKTVESTQQNLQEMNEMVRELSLKSSSASEILVDPTKVKTIEIKSKE